MIGVFLLIHGDVTLGSRYIDAFAGGIESHAIRMSGSIPGADLLSRIGVKNHQFGWFTANDEQPMIGLIEAPIPCAVITAP